MKENCIIVGAGTHGVVYAEYLKEIYEVVGFIDDDAKLIGTKVNQIEVLGGFEYLLSEVDCSIPIFVPIGNTSVKKRFLEALWNRGFSTPNYISPTADIHSSVKIANRAVYILQGSVVMPLTEIKEGVMINTNSNVAHHVVIEPYTFISSGANIGASLTIREGAFLGIGCTIMTGVKEIGANATIGAGAVVIRDVPQNAVMSGVPAKLLKYNI